MGGEVNNLIVRRVTIALVLSITLIVIPAGRALGFTDVLPSDPRWEAIEALSDLGVVSGYPDGTFRPNNPVSRQQLAKMIVLTLDLNVIDRNASGFWDTPSSSPDLYPSAFVAAAAEHGLVHGYANGSFKPLDPITRLQLMTIVVRAAAPVVREPPPGWQGLVRSTDVTHGESARRAEYSGLLAGVASELSRWDAARPATRGELSQMLHNLLVASDYRPALSATNYGAIGDGSTDCTAALMQALYAADENETALFLPAGTYRISGELGLNGMDGLLLRGAGIDKTVITADEQPTGLWMISGGDLTNVHISDMTLRSPTGGGNNVKGICLTGCRDCSLERLKIENLDEGIKLGSGHQAYGWLLDDIQTVNQHILSLFVSYVSDSVFEDLDLQNSAISGSGMCVYIERANHGLTFTNLRCTGGARYSMQLYNGYGNDASDHLSFSGTLLDARNGRHALVIGNGFSDVDFTDLAIFQPADDMGCINFYGPKRVSISGVVAEGGSSLISCATWPEAYPSDCRIRGGTYRGPWIGEVPGVIVENVIAPD